jgi:hypothetical protein
VDKKISIQQKKVKDGGGKKKRKVVTTCQDNLLGIEVKVSTIDLVKSPKKVFGGTVNIIAARIIREVVTQRGPGELYFKEIDFV